MWNFYTEELSLKLMVHSICFKTALVQALIHTKTLSAGKNVTNETLYNSSNFPHTEREHFRG